MPEKEDWIDSGELRILLENLIGESSGQTGTFVVKQDSVDSVKDFLRKKRRKDMKRAWMDQGELEGSYKKLSDKLWKKFKKRENL